MNVAAGWVSVCGAHSGAAGAAENAQSPVRHPRFTPGDPNTANMILLGIVLVRFFSGRLRSVI